MSLLPSSPDITPDGDPRVVGLDSEEADELMAALSSTTARQLLSELHDEPAPPGELAERVDTSLQNAQYHLEKLEAADAIEVVGTAYSEKGREMRVYGPADDPLVIFAGEEESASTLRAALSRLLGGFAALAGGSLLVEELFGTSFLGRDDGATDAPATESTPTPEPTPEPDDAEEEIDAADVDDAEEMPAPEVDTAEGTPTPEPTPAETPAPGPTPTLEPEAAETAFEALLAGGLPPGLAFFLGGAIVLVIVVALSYR